MVGTLDSSIAKLRRATDHFAALCEVEIRRRGGYADTYPIRPERSRDGLEYTFYVGEVPSIEVDRVATLVGDCLFNLRASLDHIVYALVERRYRGRVPDRVAKRTMFPILDEVALRGRGFTPTSPHTERWVEIGDLSKSQRS